jgi:hypothetical protein
VRAGAKNPQVALLLSEICIIIYFEDILKKKRRNSPLLNSGGEAAKTFFTVNTLDCPIPTLSNQDRQGIAIGYIGKLKALLIP